MLVMNCFKMWANKGLINIPNVDRPALSDVRWQMDGGPSVPLGLQLSGPALNLRCFCFRSLVKWCDSDTNGVRIALDLSADLSFLHCDVGNWFLQRSPMVTTILLWDRNHPTRSIKPYKLPLLIQPRPHRHYAKGHHIYGLLQVGKGFNKPRTNAHPSASNPSSTL